MKIQLKILNKEFYGEENLPEYATPGSCAVDLRCTEDITLFPGERKKIKTGLAVWIGSKDTLLVNTISKGLDDLSIYCNAFAKFPVPLSLAGLIIPRSGLGTSGLVLANTIGLIDEDYQGELIISAWNNNSCVSLYQNGEEIYIDSNKSDIISLSAGDRIAQLMFVPVMRAQFEVVEDFSNNTQRGASGFGSTGEN